MIRLHQPVFAKPKEGLKLRKEDGSYLPEDGDTVIHSSYWARREEDGDVELTAVEPEKVVTEAEPDKALPLKKANK